MMNQTAIPERTAQNPFATAPVNWIGQFLRETCSDGLRPTQRIEMEDQINALVPALVELRDAGHVQLNARALAAFASVEGFSMLACDARLSEASRRRCDAVRLKMVVQGVRALLGHS